MCRLRNIDNPCRNVYNQSLVINKGLCFMIKDRNGNILQGDAQQEKTLTFLYNNPVGKLVLKLLCRRFISNIGRAYMESRFSKGRIKKLIAQHSIDMSQYEEKEFKSFNEFFIRKVLPGKRNVDLSPDALISPADSKLTVYNITEEGRYNIKGCSYGITELLGGDAQLAKEYIGGKCLVFRLSVDNYHRYCFTDKGKVLSNRFIPGILHTVNPLALEKHDVYGKNCRELTLLETESFGKVAYIEVGAMMVGRINNRKVEAFEKGEEKGYFSFGGSTIVMLYKKDVIATDSDIAENSKTEIETTVLYGEKIGKKIG